MWSLVQTAPRKQLGEGGFGTVLEVAKAVGAARRGRAEFCTLHCDAAHVHERALYTSCALTLARSVKGLAAGANRAMLFGGAAGGLYIVCTLYLRWRYFLP